MFCCLNPSRVTNVSHEYQNQSAHRQRDARLTSLVLGFLALFLLASAFTLFGVGTLGPTTMNGLGMFPYLGGAFCGFLSLGIFMGSLVFAAISSVHACRQHQAS